MKADASELKGLKAGDAIMVQYETGEVNAVTRIKKQRTITVPVGC